MREKPKATTKPWFSRLLRHPARKRSGSILGHNTHHGPTWGVLTRVQCGTNHNRYTQTLVVLHEDSYIPRCSPLTIPHHTIHTRQSPPSLCPDQLGFTATGSLSIIQWPRSAIHAHTLHIHIHTTNYVRDWYCCETMSLSNTHLDWRRSEALCPDCTSSDLE